MPSLGGSRRRTKHAMQSKNPPPPININTTQSATPTTTTPRREVYSSLRPSKRPSLAIARPERPSSGCKEARGMGLLEKENLNVFDFMRHDDDDSDPAEDDDDDDDEPGQESPEPASSKSPSPDLSQRSPRYSDLEVRAIQDGVQRAWGRTSLHSDSGISVRSHSPDADSPVLKDKSPFDHTIPMIEESGVEDEPERQVLLSPDMNSLHLGLRHTHWPEDVGHSGPEAYAMPMPQRPVSHDDDMPEMHGRSLNTLMSYRSRRSSVQHRPSRSGYDLLASNISTKEDSVLKPLYRKFELLNHRMLLYLQDEIAQMEEDLKELDAAIAMEDHDLGRRGPASRRSEAKLPSQLQWHRLDLLGRSFAKVEQYNRALSSYANLSKSLAPASGTDITTYRRWISEHTPIAEAEAAFLDHKDDLLAVPNMPLSTLQTSKSQHEVAACSSPLTAQSSQHLQPPNPMSVLSLALVISPLLVFHVVPGLLARLLVSLLVGIAAMSVLAPEVLCSWSGVKEWRGVIGGYAVGMGVLALIV